ncbi:ComEC/Rec2 family competence protein [Marinomonas sp. M1K-6]|uniref:ComEC/Rec2 family competence protein n=1 Tax=Marinomonas profundi TaxID=2726122 RepID=A0A847QZH8_9GAMM|nr:ComEC/Rec2 family competence protein [Marinomonas profundi]NLQ16295.1 ComEC/Rec2 family competence protein [Marinomonas profundi]UDV03129.1 ComEC/Rec2 family competence protein [Marinomonas profundi]
MLLSSLSVLMGAILVPSHYFWLYSTHIILVCLYLMRTKRLIALLLTLLSFISILYHEFPESPPLSVQIGDSVSVDFDARQLVVAESSLSSVPFRKNYVSVQFFSSDGVRHTLDDFILSSLLTKQGRWVEGEVVSLVPADKEGPWWQRNLYVKHQRAQLGIRFADADESQLHSAVMPLRNQLFAYLDHAFSGFDHWRFSKALLLGSDDLWTERDTWVVRTLGLAHLFVVSGLHTGFMFAIGSVISRLIWWLSPRAILLSGVSRWHYDVIIVIPLLLGYAYITNWGEPVVRASIMLSVYLCARMMALKVSPYRIITFALWLVLLFSPRTLLSPGLWLSFSMVYLLIGFCQISTAWSRLVMVQVMLSTASMVLILGWQEAISSSAILVNIVLIPLAAFIWFPWVLLACLETLVFGSTLGYGMLEGLLVYVMRALEWLVFSAPLLHFDVFSSPVPRFLMLFLVCYWVYQSPLKRGMMGALCIWCVLFYSILFGPSKADISLENINRTLVLKKQGEILLLNGWADNQMDRLMIQSYLKVKDEGRYILSPRLSSALTAATLLQADIDWVILQKKEPPSVLAVLHALQINWLVVAEGESLFFYFSNGQISLRHSSCVYSFFLLKSDTCKRVEKLESVLNYSQI